MFTAFCISIAAVNTIAHASLCICVSPTQIPRRDAGLKGMSILNFIKSAKLPSKRAMPIYAPINRV